MTADYSDTPSNYTGSTPAFDAIREAMRKVEDVTRTLIVHPSIEGDARLAVRGQGPWRIVTNDSMDPAKVFVMASPAEVRERVEHYEVPRVE